MIYPFSGLLYLTLEFCAGERRLNNTRRHLHVSRRYSSVTPGIYSLCECVMSVIRWLAEQEVCSRFEFTRHFESHLARPPPFYMRMRTTISDEHSIVTMLLSTRIIFSTYRFYFKNSREFIIYGFWSFGPKGGAKRKMVSKSNPQNVTGSLKFKGQVRKIIKNNYY